MSTEPLENSSEPEIDEVEAALSNLEVTLESGHTDRILVNRCLWTINHCCESQVKNVVLF